MMPAMPKRDGLRSNLAALTYADYRNFSVSLLLTQLGAQLIQTAVLWQVYEITGSAVLLGLTGFARAVPHMALSLVGGVVADRFNRRQLIQIGQASNAVLVFVLALVTLSGHVELWHLYAITSVNAAVTAVTQPARTALIPRIVPPHLLVNAIGLNATIQQSAQIFGPALGGLAIGTIGLGWGYMITAGSYIVAMVALFWMRTPAMPPATEDSPWQSFVEGMQFVRARPAIISLLLIDVLQTLFGGYRALLPIFADLLHVGATGYGVLSAAPGVGSIIGATFILSRGDMRYKGLYAVTGTLVYCVSQALLSASPWFLLTLVAVTLLGVTNSIQVIPRNTAILSMSPDALRGRVEAFRSMLAGGVPPLGFTLAGALAAAFGAPIAMLIGSGACAVFVVGLATFRRELRDPDLGAPPPEPAAPAVLRTSQPN